MNSLQCACCHSHFIIHTSHNCRHLYLGHDTCILAVAAELSVSYSTVTCCMSHRRICYSQVWYCAVRLCVNQCSCVIFTWCILLWLWPVDWRSDKGVQWVLSNVLRSCCGDWWRWRKDCKHGVCHLWPSPVGVLTVILNWITLRRCSGQMTWAVSVRMHVCLNVWIVTMFNL